MPLLFFQYITVKRKKQTNVQESLFVFYLTNVCSDGILRTQAEQMFDIKHIEDYFGGILMKRRTLLFVFCFLLIAVIISGSIMAQASKKESSRNKYFTSVYVNPGDSLWSIAEQFITEEYESISDYIQEIKRMNNLKSNDIHAGNYLMVCYYQD